MFRLIVAALTAKTRFKHDEQYFNEHLLRINHSVINKFLVVFSSKIESMHFGRIFEPSRVSSARISYLAEQRTRGNAQENIARNIAKTVSNASHITHM